LERVLGKKTAKNEIFAETVKLAHEKKLVTHAPAARGRFPIKAVARTLDAALDGFPRCVEWLSDNGSCYTGAETTAFARSLGLISCFTRVQDLESNSMAGAFVRAFKRDDIYVHERPYAKRIMAQL
jgi:transposase InsO family protein